MKNYVITIARGFGSGGKYIGTKLGERLGIPCYEREILAMASEERRLCHYDDFMRSGNIINGANWHTVPGSECEAGGGEGGVLHPPAPPNAPPPSLRYE